VWQFPLAALGVAALVIRLVRGPRTVISARPRQNCGVSVAGRRRFRAFVGGMRTSAQIRRAKTSHRPAARTDGLLAASELASRIETCVAIGRCRPRVVQAILPWPR